MEARVETIRIAIELDAEPARRGRSSAPAAIELHLMIKGQPRGLRADAATREQWAATYAERAYPLAVAPLPTLREIV